MKNLVLRSTILAWCSARGVDPAGIVNLGIPDGDYVDIDPRVLNAAMRQFYRSGRSTMHGSPGQLPEEPSIAELATNFAGAMSRWAAGGFPTLDQAGYDARAAVCDACEFWDGSARLGLGKCGAPGCGCTGMKRWLATEQCPLGKWPAVSAK